MQDRSHILTEQRLAESMSLDSMSIEDAVALMNAQDALAVAAVGTQRAQIAAAVKMIAAALRIGGRLFYIGAGSSGRLGVLDASECPPTFGTDPSLVQGIIAGGREAMFRSQEGAEDHADGGAMAMADAQVSAADVVLGIAAGGTTPFVAGALNAARQQGAKTIFLTCAQPTVAEARADLVIRPLTGPEVLTGSTRLKAGTATKLVLNTLSTLAMVQLGKVHENLMIDLRATNQKLRDRALRILMSITQLERSAAEDLLQRADGKVKPAIVMHARGVNLEKAEGLLKESHGNLRLLLRNLP